MLKLQKEGNLLTTLILLTSVVVFAQLSVLFIFFFINNHTAAALFNFVAATQTLLYVTSVILPVVRFVLEQIVLYVLFVALIWYVTRSLGELCKLRERQIYTLGIVLWCVSVMAVIAANHCYFPSSHFTALDYSVLGSHVTVSAVKWLLIVLCVFLAVALCGTLINLVMQLYHNTHRLRHSLVLLLLLCVGLICVTHQFTTRPYAFSTATAQQPNVIVIGLDALRPDFIGVNNPNIHTPNIDQFVRSSTSFTDNYTPLARTFPAWMSILTSSYPKHNFVRGNFADLQHVHYNASLPAYLQQHGYETLFATDDTGALTLTKSMGFDHTLGPSQGVNTFLLGYLNDFPLSNLIVRTAVGKLLFPYSYGCHLAIATYAPNNFLNLVQQGLHQRTGKPLFLAIHFNLSGWPYYFERPNLNLTLPGMYSNDAEAADKQLGDFFQILAQNDLLTHSIVILLSDHGMGLGLPGDLMLTDARYQGNPRKIRLTRYAYSDDPHRYVISLENSAWKKGMHIDTSFGYGSDVLSRQQYQTLLAFKGYGVDLGKPHIVTERSSLLDIMPTLVDVLHLPHVANLEGESLKSYLFHPEYHVTKPRMFFLESGLTYPEMQQAHVSVDKVLAKLGKLYRVDAKTGLVFIPDDIQRLMSHDKERAIVWGDWALADFPATQRYAYGFDPIDKHHPHAQRSFHFITFVVPPRLFLINLKTKQWTNDMHQPFVRTAPLQPLLTKLRDFYGDELLAAKFSKKTEKLVTTSQN